MKNIFSKNRRNKSLIVFSTGPYAAWDTRGAKSFLRRTQFF